MGIIKKLLLVSIAVSLSACSMFEGKNTFMTYQDLQDQVKTNGTDLQDVKAKLAKVDELEAEVAKLKQSQGTADSSATGQNTMSSNTSTADGTPMPVTNVAPAVTAAPMASSQTTTNAQTVKPAVVAASPVTPVAAPSQQAATQPKDNAYGVQLAAYGSRSEAARGWMVLNNASPDVYVNLVPHVNEKMVNGRTMYQLKVGPFLDKAYSVDFCNMLKQKGKDCIVSKYDGQPL